MGSVNVNDRSSIEAIYPREAFEADAAQNARGKASVLHGVLIASEVSESGTFALQRAKRQAGERDPLGDTLFLAPFPPDPGGGLRQATAYGGTEETARPEAMEPRGDGYEAFIDRIVEAAAGAAFKEPVGRHDERLRGFRGG